MRTRWSAVRWHRLSSTCYNRRKTTLTYNIGYRRRLSACFSNIKRLTMIRAFLLRPRVLLLCHYLLLAQDPGERDMYDTMLRAFCWLQMASNIYATAINCRFWAWHHRTTDKQGRNCRFPSSRSLEYAAMDIIGPFPKAEFGIQISAVISNSYSKLAKAIPTLQTTVAVVETLLIDHMT